MIKFPKPWQDTREDLQHEPEGDAAEQQDLDREGLAQEDLGWRHGVRCI